MSGAQLGQLKATTHTHVYTYKHPHPLTTLHRHAASPWVSCLQTKTWSCRFHHSAKAQREGSLAEEQPQQQPVYVHMCVRAHVCVCVCVYVCACQPFSHARE